MKGTLRPSSWKHNCPEMHAVTSRYCTAQLPSSTQQGPLFLWLWFPCSVKLCTKTLAIVCLIKSQNPESLLDPCTSQHVCRESRPPNVVPWPAQSWPRLLCLPIGAPRLAGIPLHAASNHHGCLPSACMPSILTPTLIPLASTAVPLALLTLDNICHAGSMGIRPRFSLDS